MVAACWFGRAREFGDELKRKRSLEPYNVAQSGIGCFVEDLRG